MVTICLMSCVLLCLLLWSEVHSQTEFPFVSFRGETLPNHVDLALVGDAVLNSSHHSVQCHSDLDTCCSASQGQHRGDWCFPNGDKLPFFSPTVGIHEAHPAQRVESYIGTMLTHHLVYIAVISQLLLSITTMIPQ